MVSLFEGEWSCYRGGQLNGGRIVILQRWPVDGWRMVMLQRWSLMEGEWSFYRFRFVLFNDTWSQ